MTTEQMVLEAVKKLPNKSPMEDATERLLFSAKIGNGIHQANAGETMPHDRAKERMRK